MQQLHEKKHLGHDPTTSCENVRYNLSFNQIYEYESIQFSPKKSITPFLFSASSGATQALDSFCQAPMFRQSYH